MRLLVVEDDPELGRRLTERLRSADFAVELAASRSEAEDWPDVDRMSAVLLDLGLPDGSGLELLRHWRDRRVETPIVILTARGSWQDKVEGLNAGADDFVVKPVRFEELLARLNACSGDNMARAQPSSKRATSRSIRWRARRCRRDGSWRSAVRNFACCTCSCAAPGNCFHRETSSMIFTRWMPTASATRSRC